MDVVEKTEGCPDCARCKAHTEARPAPVTVTTIALGVLLGALLSAFAAALIMAALRASSPGP